jgi:hypothetical protein
MLWRKAGYEFLNVVLRGTVLETNDFLTHRTVTKFRCDPTLSGA